MRRTRRSYVVLLSGDKVLVVKGWLGNQLWHLPGGGVHQHETPAQAVVRETHEEVGIELEFSALKRLVNDTWQSERLGFDYHIFGYPELTGTPLPKFRRYELRDAQWIAISDLSSGNTSPEVLDAIDRARHFVY